jgi:hypothetical protein
MNRREEETFISEEESGGFVISSAQTVLWGLLAGIGMGLGYLIIDRLSNRRGKLGNPIDPCAEAQRTFKLYEDDVEAGHSDAAPYWKGQSEAFGIMCTAMRSK